MAELTSVQMCQRLSAAKAKSGEGLQSVPLRTFDLAALVARRMSMAYEFLTTELFGLRGHSLDAISAHIQLSCARYIRWLIGDFALDNGTISIQGWALPCGPGRELSILINGEPFSEVKWPIASPDLSGVFPILESAKRARFECGHSFETLDDIFNDGFLRLDWCAGEPNQRSYRSAWYFPDPRGSAPTPEENRIARVIGTPDLNSFLFGGASLHKRFDGYLSETFHRPLRTFQNILDWGCGSGRLTRHLCTLNGPRVTGCDIDGDNIKWCSENLDARFVSVPLLPPSPFDAGEFDLVIGCSVFTHLDEDKQFAWLDELRRITAPGGIVLATVQGPSQAALLRASPALISKVEQKGFVDKSVNMQLSGFVEDGYYHDVIQSRDYIFSKWNAYFEIVDIVDAFAANQDVVVMRRSRPR